MKLERLWRASWEVLTVLMLTLMTGMSERHEDAGSGLSALMFTLYHNQRTLSYFSIKRIL